MNSKQLPEHYTSNLIVKLLIRYTRLNSLCLFSNLTVDNILEENFERVEVAAFCSFQNFCHFSDFL